MPISGPCAGSRCAQICGYSRRSLSAKLAAYQIDKTPFRTL